MRKIKLLFILTSAFLSLGSADPVYDYMLITTSTGAIANRDWQQESLTMPEPLPPRRSVPEQYRDLFTNASESTGIPLGVLESIAFVESEFLTTARSPIRRDGHRDLGMFQFNDRYLQWYSDMYNGGVLFDPFLPEEAILIAALHVAFLYERYGNWSDVFFAYNSGMDRVDRDDVPESAWNYLLKIYRSEP